MAFNKTYSCLKDSMGLNLAALIAGTIPNIRPITVEKERASIIGLAVTAVVNPTNLVNTIETITAKSIPKIPVSYTHLTLPTIYSV